MPSIPGCPTPPRAGAEPGFNPSDVFSAMLCTAVTRGIPNRSHPDLQLGPGGWLRSLVEVVHCQLHHPSYFIWNWS
jgi:hypothetical protein